MSSGDVAAEETQATTRNISWIGWLVLAVPSMIVIFLFFFGDMPWLASQSDMGAANEAEKQLSFGREKERIGLLRDAAAHYLSALQIKADYPEACVALGKLYYQIGEKEQALDWLYKALEMDPPEEDLIYNNLGMIYASQGEYRKSLGMFQRSLEMGLKKGIIYKNLGNVYMSLGQYDDAIDSYQKALEHKPGMWTLYVDILTQVKINNYVSPFLALSDLNHTKDWLQRLQAQHTPLDQYIWAYIAPVINNHDNDDQTPEERVISQLNKMLREETFCTSDLFSDIEIPDEVNEMMQGELVGEDLYYVNRRLLDTAYPDYIIPITSTSDKDHGHDVYLATRDMLRRGVTDSDLVYFDEESVRQYVSYSDQTSRYHDYLGLAYFSAGRNDAAIEQFEEAIRLWPSNASAFLHLGNALTEKGDFEAAEDALESALSINPRWESAQVALSLLRERMR